MALTKITSRILDSSGVTILGTIATGVWQGTAINQTYLVGQSGTNTGDETLARINALDVTELGTVSSGVWNGTAIASAYLDADTAHLSTTQTFTGAKTFSSAVLIQQSGSTGFVTEKTGGTGSFINLKDNAGTVFIGGVNNEFVVQTSGSSYSNKLTISNAGNATFSGSVTSGGTITNELSSGDAIVYAKNGTVTTMMIANSTAENIGIAGTESAHDYVIRTSNSEKMRISSGGNVGISNTNPLFELCIGATDAPNRNGLEFAISNTDTGINIVQNYNRATSAYTPMSIAASEFSVSTGSGATQALTILSGGNVGIGTTSPNAKLDIVSLSAASSPYISKAIQFAPSNHPTRTWSLNYDDGGSAGNGFNISSSGTRILYLNANGRVGIGTASPGQKLVIGGGTNGRVRIKVTEAVNNFGKFEFSTSDSATSSAAMIAEITAKITQAHSSSLKSELSFSTNSGDSLTEQMRIHADGDINVLGGRILGSAGIYLGTNNNVNLLNDYEEGTWDPTPGRTGDPQPNVSTYAYREGTYVKVGKLVTVMWDFAATITSQGSTAAISIKGLPFAVGTSIANGGKMAGYGVVQFRSGSLYVNTTAQRSLTGFVQQGATYIYVESQKMGTDGFASAGSVDNYLLNVSSARSTGTCTYFTNQ